MRFLELVSFLSQCPFQFLVIIFWRQYENLTFVFNDKHFTTLVYLLAAVKALKQWKTQLRLYQDQGFGEGFAVGKLKARGKHIEFVDITFYKKFPPQILIRAHHKRFLSPRTLACTLVCLLTLTLAWHRHPKSPGIQPSTGDGYASASFFSKNLKACVLKTFQSAHRNTCVKEVKNSWTNNDIPIFNFLGENTECVFLVLLTAYKQEMHPNQNLILLRIVRKSIVILAFQKSIEFPTCSLNGLFQTQQFSPAISLRR